MFASVFCSPKIEMSGAKSNMSLIGYQCRGKLAQRKGVTFRLHSECKIQYRKMVFHFRYHSHSIAACTAAPVISCWICKLAASPLLKIYSTGANEKI